MRPGRQSDPEMCMRLHSCCWRGARFNEAGARMAPEIMRPQTVEDTFD